MIFKRVILMLLLTLICAFCVSCDFQNKSEFKDGYYTAEDAEFSHGWKEYVSITVNNGIIVAVEFNAKNASGFIKAWDIAYMEKMQSIEGTYPNQYTRFYGGQLLENQNVDVVDMISGASNSGGNFIKLSKAVLDNAKKGNTDIIVVK